MRFKKVHIVFLIGHLITSLLFILSAVALMAFAVIELWDGINPLVEAPLQDRLNDVLEGIAVLTVSVASLELGQTIMEEEVQRDIPMSIPSRVRRFLSRFMIVLVVSLYL